MRRLNLSVIVYICLVFLSGVLLGWVGYSLYNSRSVDAALKTNPCTPQAVRLRYIDEMQTRLKLRAPQVQKLSAILEETHHRFKALREKYKPELKVIQEEQAVRIRAILDDTQRAEYEKVRQEREKADQKPKK
jgi:hypothetical protein